MRVVLRMSAIVAALAVTTSAALSGCGQRGPLYLPTVPPLPKKPSDQIEPPPSDIKPDAETGSNSTARPPLTLAPAGELDSPPNASKPSAVSAASSATPDQ